MRREPENNTGSYVNRNITIVLNLPEEIFEYRNGKSTVTKATLHIVVMFYKLDYLQRLD